MIKIGIINSSNRRKIKKLGLQPFKLNCVFTYTCTSTYKIYLDNILSNSNSNSEVSTDASAKVPEKNSDKSSKKKLSSLLQLAKFLRPYRKTLFGAIVALIFTAGITLSIGYGVRLIIDEGLGGQTEDSLSAAVGFMMILAILMAVGTFVRFYLVSWLGERVSADIRQKVFDHLITLHPSYFETNRSGEIMSRLTTDTTLLQSIIGSSFSMALRNSLTFIGALAIMIITNIKLTLVVLSGVPLVLLPILFYGNRVRKLSTKSQDSIASVGTYAGEIIQQMKTVQSYSRETEEVKAFEIEVETAFNIARKRILQRAVLIAAVILMVFASIIGVFMVGGSAVLAGTMSSGELAAFFFYTLMMGSAVATWSEVISELQRAAGATDRLIELMEVPSDITAPSGEVEDASTKAASMELKNINFHYPSRPDQKALQHLSLKIEEGKSLALVGPSGAGKSTVFELLQRFYDPQQGIVTLGDCDIRSFSPQQLRQQMSLVAQQPALFTADVRYNISYGKIDATEDEIIAAAKAAHADDFIRALPQAYDSHLGEQGVRLSGGQKQRLAIARAILKNPRILLLDEATSALDAESEHKVQLALNTLMKNRTTVIIAHRLATILHVDKIAVLDQGRVVATGTHQELIESNELYKRLAELQFKVG